MVKKTPCHEATCLHCVAGMYVDAVAAERWPLTVVVVVSVVAVVVIVLCIVQFVAIVVVGGAVFPLLLSL